MGEKILFELVAPARLLISSPVDMVVVPGADGDFGAMPRHAPVISAVRPGVVDVHDGGKVSNRVFVTGGFAEVNEKCVTVLAEEAIPLAHVTKHMAAQWLDAGKTAMAEAKSEREKHQAEHKLAVAAAMEEVAAH